MIGQMKNGIIVEGLEDGKRFPVHGSSKVSALEEISIYTDDSEIPLKEVFDRMFERSEGKAVLSHKEDKKKIKAFFSEVVPEYDPDRVYVSDMVKVVKWFNLLIEFTDYQPGEEEGETDASVEAEADPGSPEAEEVNDASQEEEVPEAAEEAAAPAEAKEAPDTEASSDSDQRESQ